MSGIIYQSELFSVLFLLLPLFIFLYLSLQRWRKERLEIYIHKGVQGEKERFSIKVLFLLLAYLAAVIALMQPQAKSENKKMAPQELNEIAFVLDVSQSMGAKDGGKNGGAIEESRIARAKEVIQQVVQSIGGVNISLYAFQSDLALVVPPTLDYLYFQFALQNAEIGSTSLSGTDFNAMLKAMKERIIDSSVRKKMRIICLTDGEDTSLFDLLPQALAKKESEKRAYLQDFRDAQIAWSMVGVGTTKGAPVPNVANRVTHLVPETLREFQKETNGSSYLAQDLALQDIVDGIVSDVGVEKETASGTFTPLFFYPIVIACLFLIIHLFIKEEVKNG